MPTEAHHGGIFRFTFEGKGRGDGVSGNAPRFFANLVPKILEQGIRVVDLSGAWRLRESENRAVYGFDDPDAKAANEVMGRAVYGLPELLEERNRSGRGCGESWMLRNVGDSRSGATGASRIGRSGPRSDLGLEVRRIGCRKRTIGPHAFRRRRRQFVGL